MWQQNCFYIWQKKVFTTVQKNSKRLYRSLKEILPIVDTLEMAAGYNGDKVAEGVKMTLTQFKDTLKKLGIEEIPAEVGAEFDPEMHNAVMSQPNPELPEGSISMVLRKGYKKGDKVYRYTMVAVNN